MSQEVDSRVVEMRFDNANFEKNTKQTISTIDRLMEKLQFKGAEKGFEKLDAAAENVDFATMQTSLDRLESKFSSLNIVATTALVNITNKFVDAGEKLVKSLSIDQVASGWDKYTEKTSNVQTIMNATGKSIDQVNGYLNKLMWYSDETSYSFSEMTRRPFPDDGCGRQHRQDDPHDHGHCQRHRRRGQNGLCVPEHHPEPDPELQRRTFAASGLEEPEPDGYGHQGPEAGAH